MTAKNIPDEEWAEIRASQRYVGTFHGMPYDDSSSNLLLFAALIDHHTHTMRVLRYAAYHDCIVPDFPVYFL